MQENIHQNLHHKAERERGCSSFPSLCRGPKEEDVVWRRLKEFSSTLSNLFLTMPDGLIAVVGFLPSPPLDAHSVRLMAARTPFMHLNASVSARPPVQPPPNIIYGVERQPTTALRR